MTVAYVVGGRVNLDAATTVPFHEAFAAVREAYDRAARWTGLTVPQLLTDELPDDPEERQSRGSLRQAALVLGLADVLAERGVTPSVTGGVSLGGMTAGVLAGGLGRDHYLRFLHQQRLVPHLPPDAPEQAVARAFVPAEDDPAGYHGAARPGVHLAGDFGPVLEGTKRMLLLGGRRTAIEKLAASLPERTVLVLEGQTIAAHTELRAHEREFLSAYVNAMPFTDPPVPVCSAVQPDARALTTAEQVRDLFDRNPVAPITMPGMLAELGRLGTRLGVVLGRSIPKGVIDFPFPVVHVQEPADVEQAVTAATQVADSGARV
ncbi:ACP S-malonyltransferase [Streptomyces sp. NPDC001714]|uniref:ACP S-malonyltransferase n=1 Tax=Streptomyces sp. NPDC001714 TaxID=3364603 RepID=UPI0036B39D68